MRELNALEINEVYGGTTPQEQASQLSANLAIATGLVSIAAGATFWFPPVSAGLWVLAGGLGALSGVAAAYTLC